MFVRLRIMAHDALKNYMHGEHEPLNGDTTLRIYDVIRTAETNTPFADALDFECSMAFDEETAEGYEDLVLLFNSKKYMPEGLRELLTRYGITTED